MTTLQDTKSRLPDVALSDLPEKTKDFLIAHSAGGKSVPEIITAILNQAAEEAIFHTPTLASSPSQPATEAKEGEP